MTVELTCGSPRARSYARAVAADARRLLRLGPFGRCDLSILLTGDREIRRLNRRFRSQDRPTDVLSFSQIENNRRHPSPDTIRRQAGRASLMLGDIAISIETAARQASGLDVPTRARVRTLLIHGFLHLTGYDHERSARDARIMFARERILARKLNGHSL